MSVRLSVCPSIRPSVSTQGWRDPDGRLEFWKNVHGLDYSSMANLPLDEASVEVVGRKDMMTGSCLCKDFNIETVKDEVSPIPYL